LDPAVAQGEPKIPGPQKRMKSFRLYTPPPEHAVERYVSDYTVEERTQLWEEFRPVAERYRRARRNFSIFMVSGVIFLVSLYALLRTNSLIPIIISLIMLVACVFWIALSQALNLKCPGCKNDLMQFARYCPVCGSDQLQPGRWFRGPYCPNCQKSLYRGKHCNYKIHACTHCGLVLDEKGL
jgi:hypothetical protein